MITSIAKSYGGSYNRFAKRFFFTKQNSKEANEQKRDTFIEKVKQMLQDKGVKYSIHEGTSRTRALGLDVLKNDIAEAFPNAKTISDRADSVVLKLPNDIEVKFKLSPSIAETDEHAEARTDHGIANDVDITVNGYTLTKAKQAFVELAQNGEDGTAFHEVFHIAYDMALTEKEKQAINIAFKDKAKATGKTVEEYAADKYRDWKLKRREIKGKWKMALEKIEAVIDRMRRALLGSDTVHDIFKDIESGKVWERGSQQANSPIDVFLEKFDNVTKDYWDSVGYSDEDMRRCIDEVSGAIKDDVKAQLARAHTHNDIDDIRNRIPGIRKRCDIYRFNKTSLVNDYMAVSARIGLEVFENDKHVKAARDRVEQTTSTSYQRREDIRNLQGIRDGLNSKAGRRTSNFEFAISGFRVSDNIKAIPANEHYVNQLEEFEANYENEYGKKHYSVSRSDNQDGFSNANTDEAIQQQEQGILGRAVNALAKKLGLKKNHDSRIIVADNGNDADYINPLQKWVGSPGRIAEKIPVFRPFFEMGSRATEEVVRTRSRFNRKLDNVLNVSKDSILKTAKDKEDLFHVLVTGDMDSHEYTADELRDMGYNDNIYKAYKKVRGIMESLYIMVDKAKRHVHVYKYNGMSVRMYNRLQRANKFVKITKAVKNSDGNYDVIWKGTSRWDYKCRELWEKREKDVSGEALKVMLSDSNTQITKAWLVDGAGRKKSVKVADLDIDTINDTDTFEIRYCDDIPPVNKLEGYIPHFFHEYMVRIKGVDNNGKVITIATLGSGRTEDEAVQVAEEWLKNNPDTLEGEQKIIIQPKAFNFDSIAPGSEEQEGETKGMSFEKRSAVIMGINEMEQMFRNIAAANEITYKEAKEIAGNSIKVKSRHRFFGNLMHRTGVENYEKNMDWVLRHYANMACRYSAMESLFKPDAINMFERTFGAFDKEYNDIAKYIKDYINDINGNPSDIEKTLNDFLNHQSWWRKNIVSSFGERAALRASSAVLNPISYMTLGCLNVSSALLNLSQIMNAAAYIGDVSAIGNILKAGARKGVYNRKDMRILAETGVLNNIGLDSGSGYDINRSGEISLGNALSSVKNAADYVGNKGMILFKTTESFIRRGTVIAAYNKARADGKNHAEAIRFAKEVNRKSNFDYGVADAPNIFRRGSIISQIIFQFKKYPIKEMEVIADMLPYLDKGTTNNKQKAMFWTMYFLTCGLLGLPFLDWPDEQIGERTGFYPKDYVQESIMELAGDSKEGELLANMLMYGGSTVFCVDVSSRAGLSDVIPTKPTDLLGAMPNKISGLVGDTMKFIAEPSYGNGANAIRDLSPGIYNIMTAVAGSSTGKRGRTMTRYEDAWSRILRAAGFRSVEESNVADVERIMKRNNKKKQQKEQEAIDAYIENPSGKNGMRLKELGISPKRVQAEREKKKMDRTERLTSGMSKQKLKEAQGGVLQFLGN